MKNPRSKNNNALSAENTRLRNKLAMAKTRERDLVDTRRAMLFLLEDVNETTAGILRAKKEWETTFDAIKDPIFIHDAEFRILRANTSYRDAAKLSFSRIIGRPYYEVFPLIPAPLSTCLNAIKKTEETQEEINLPETDKFYRISSYPVKDNEGYSYTIHVMEDITERKRIFEELKSSRENLRQELEISSYLLMIADATAGKTDVNRMMEEAANACSKIMGTDACLTYLWNGSLKTFRPSEAIGLKKELVAFFKTESLGEGVGFIDNALKGTTALLHPSKEMLEGSFLKSLDALEAIVTIPLEGRLEHLGVIIGVYEKKVSMPEFTDRFRAITKAIAQQVSTALEEAKLYKESVDRAMELSNKMETIRTMHEIDRAILSTLDPAEILETSVMMITKLIPCDRATVALVDKEKGGFIYKAGFGVSFLEKGSFIKFEDTNGTDVIKSGKPQYVANLSEVKDLPLLEKKFLSDGYMSHIRVPLILKEGIVGVLTVGAKRTSVFTPGDLSILENISTQISIALENAHLLEGIEELFMGTITTLSEAIDAKSRWTAGHSHRVTGIALSMGKELGMTDKELKRLELAGILHDIGKIGTGEYVLDKPGRLTDDETSVMRRHPARGAEIIRHIKQLSDIVPAVRNHHECYDGTGYPDGIKGEDIHLFARILAVADTVDAMASDRPYRKGKPMEAIVEELKRCQGAQFDPMVVDAFLKTLEGALL